MARKRADVHLTHGSGEKMKQINQDVKLLPIANIDGREFLVDVEQRELRDFNNPENIIKMHSAFGRQLIKEMQGTQWNSMGISTSTGTDKSIEA